MEIFSSRLQCSLENQRPSNNCLLKPGIEALFRVAGQDCPRDSQNTGNFYCPWLSCRGGGR